MEPLEFGVERKPMGKKVLIVDDSSTFRAQVAGALSEAGFLVVEGVDGYDGIAKLAENPDISLVISDVIMPNMTGLEMLETIKAMPQHAGLPFLLLTTEGGKDMIDRARAAGAKGWLVKPFKSEQIVAAARKLT